MDFKYLGASNYNNADWIKTKGFDSMIDFEKKQGKVTTITMPDHSSKVKSSEEAKK